MNTWLFILAKFIVWRNMRLFSWRDKIWFFICGSWVYLIYFLSSTKYFYKISNLLLSLVVDGTGLWILLYQISIFNRHLVNILLCFKWIWFKTQNIKYRLISRLFIWLFKLKLNYIFCFFFRVAIVLIYFSKDFGLDSYVKLRGWYNYTLKTWWCNLVVHAKVTSYLLTADVH